MVRQTKCMRRTFGMPGRILIGLGKYDLRGYGKTAQDVEHKSKTSEYGKTWSEPQMDDLEWAIEEAQKEGEALPVFIQGCSFVRSSPLVLPVFWLNFL